MLNERIFKKCNILQWHEAGYTGKGVKVGILDLSNDLYERQKVDPHIHHIFPEQGSAYGGHVAPCVDIIQQIAPDAEIYVLNYNSDNAKWLLDNDVDIVSVSVAGFGFTDEVVKAYELSDTVLFAAAGNSGMLTKPYPASYDWSITVAGVNANTDKYYTTSSWNDKMDCCGYTYVDVLTNKGTTFQFNGTSCATPWVAGMYALLRQKVGKQNWQEAKKLIHNNCLDYLDEGWDNRSGYGLFILPDVEDVDMKIEMQIGSDAAYVDGELYTLPQKPIVINGTTLVPLRFVSEALGCNVEYIPEGKKIIITK